MAAAAATVKKIALELGGKNPNIVFADADLEVALDFALTAVFLHSGQVCSAGARLLVEETIHDEFVDRLVERAASIRLGGPHDAKAETGPLISAAHREKVAAYVAAGVAEGAVLRCGGSAPDDPELQDGFYYLPTVLDGCTSDMTVTQDESFGPVLTVETFTHRGRGGRDRQRQHLRTGRRGLDPGRRQGPAGRGPAAHGHRLDQRLPPVRPAGRVGRLQAVRRGSRARRGRVSTSTARPSTSGTTCVPPSSTGSRTRPGWGADERRPVRRRHRRRWLRRLRAGQPHLRRPRHQRAGPRGGPLRLADRPVRAHARGAADPDRQPLLRLEVPARTPSRT